MRMMITYRGTTLPLRLWSVRLGIAYQTLRDRLNRYGWSVHKAFTTPAGRRVSA